MERHNNIKRKILLMLAFIMIISSLPINVLAEGLEVEKTDVKIEEMQETELVTPEVEEQPSEEPKLEEEQEVPVPKEDEEVLEPEIPNLITKIVTKIWIGGLMPDTNIELWRKGLNENGELVEEKVGDFIANENNTVHEFSNLEETNPQGIPYEYFAIEPVVPENYEKHEDGLTITNKYIEIDEPLKDPEEIIEEEIPEKEIIKEENPEDIKKEEEKIEDNGYIDPFDNPDNLSGEEPDLGPVVLDYANSDVRYESRSTFAPMNNGNPVIGQDHPQNPGDVMLFKEAHPVSGLLNTYDVILRIEAKDTMKSNDIVLVIDTSGSMQGNKITKAKAAAIKFVNQLLIPEHPDTRIALVSFAGDSVSQVGFRNYTNRQTLINAINGLVATGGTHTQAGVRAARNYLAGSTADMKQIVLLSDGDPTYSYNMNNRANYLVPFADGQETSKTVPEFEYTTSRVGNGTSLRTRFSNNSTNFYNHGNSAIAESGFSKNSGHILHTISLDAGAMGTQILAEMASPGNSHAAISEEQLEGIYANIASQIIAAMRNPHVSDPMGLGFKVIPGVGTITVSQGTYTLDEANSTINWNMGEVLLNSVEGLPDVKYAELKYRIEVDDRILDVDPRPTDGNYQTNGQAQVTYTDSNNNSQTIDFPKPIAHPIIIEMAKVLLDATGKPIPESEAIKRTFRFQVSVHGDDFIKYYDVKGNKSRIMTDLRIDKTHKIVEDHISGEVVTTFSDYDTNISWETWDGSQSASAIPGTTLESFPIPRTNGEPLNTTIRIENKEKALGKLTITKQFEPTAAISKSRSTPTFKVQVIGKNIYNPGDEVYNETFDIIAGQTIELEDLVYGEYTVVETETNGFIASYSDSEGDPSDGIVKIQVNGKNQSVLITNRPAAGEDKVDFVATKTWVGGNPEDHVKVVLTLYRDGQIYSTESPAITPDSGSEYTYTWKDLPKYNQTGGLHEYSVREEISPQYYEVTYPSADKVVNTYNPDLNTITITANKVWVNGPMPRPTVWFTLYRELLSSGVVEKVGTKELDGINSVTWENMPKTDNSGESYLYTLKETDANGVDFTPENYEKREVGFTITNTYKSPETEELVFTKEWEGGPTTKPEISFQLMRRNGTAGIGEAVGAAKVVENNTVNFGKQDKTDINGVVYEYYVKEVGEVNGLITLNGLKYSVVYTGTKVTNTYVVENIDITATKVWVNGPVQKPEIGFKLYRKTAETDIDAVSGATTVRLLSGTTEAKWTGLYKNDPEGREYIYSVVEVNQQDEPFEPENYTKVEDGLTVTNTYVIPKGEVVGEKIWVEGPDNKPEIYFTLYRNTSGTSPVKIEGSTKIVTNNVNPDTPFGAIWQDVELTDIDGNPYIFTVKETDAEGNDYTPSGYTKLELEMTVTNYYAPPSDGVINIAKVWEDVDGITRPNIEINLYRIVEGGEEEIVLAAAPFVPSGDETRQTHKWENIVTHNEEGKPYKFFVREKFTDDNPINAYWLLAEDIEVELGELAATDIINRPLNEDERKGKLTIEKVLENELPDRIGTRGLPIAFSFKVTGPNGYEEEFDLVAGETKELTGLFYGTYKIEETETHGYVPTYEDEEVTLTPDKPEGVMKVTNSRKGGDDDPNSIDIKVEKEWCGGPKPNVQIKLMRSFENKDNELIVEEVDTFTATATILSKEYKGLPKHNKDGYEYKYYVEEPNVPANYTRSIKGYKVINTYKTSEVCEITAKKVWNDYRSFHPTIWFRLYRNIKDGNLEAVPGAEIKKLENGITEVSWKNIVQEDVHGNKYIFSVREVDEFGNDYVPIGYEKTEKGLVVTNREIVYEDDYEDDDGYYYPGIPELNKEDHIPYVIGYPDGSFRPEGNITRAEVSAIFARLLKEKIFLNENYPIPYSDVSLSGWYTEYIGLLTHLRIIAGYPDGTFRPDNSMTRAEFATIASRFIRNKKSMGGFRDVNNEYWARENIEYVKAEGWVMGYPDGTFRPEQFITRAEVVNIVNKMLDRNADKGYVDRNVLLLYNYNDLTNKHWAYYPIMEASNGHDYTRLTNKGENWIRHWKPINK